MAPREKKEDLLIVNRRTGKALQCAGTENGSIVMQAAITGVDAQLWTPVKAGKAVKFRNKQSGRVLDVTHGSTEAGTWVQIWDDVPDGESQLWQQVKVTATYKKLLNVQSGKVLDIVDMREDDGAPAQIWDDVDGAGQQWKLVEPSAPKAASPAKEAPGSAEPEEPKPAPKKRGRKPAEPAVEAVPAEPAPAEEEPAPKKRGRKPAAANVEKKPAEKTPKTPARRGRKPKTEA